MVVEHRLQRLVDSREAERVSPDGAKIVVFWEKALASSRDCRRGLSPDNAVTLGYQAAMQAAIAVLDSAGWRIKGASGGHHQRTFYALAALELPGLLKVDVESESIRRMRKRAFYDADEATQDQADALIAWLDQLLPACRKALETLAPDIAGRLP